MLPVQGAWVRSLVGELGSHVPRAHGAANKNFKKKNICDSWEEVNISKLRGVWKKLIPALLDDFEGFETSWRKDCRRGGNGRGTRARSGG